MLFSKSPVKDISQKIKPPQASIKNLKFERKKDFDSFLTYIKRETKTLDDIKLPKTAEVQRKPFPLLGALLGFGALGLFGMFGGFGSGSEGDTTNQEFSEKDSNFKLTSLSLASMKAFSNKKGKGRGNFRDRFPKKKDDDGRGSTGAEVNIGKGGKKTVDIEKTELDKTKRRARRIIRKRFVTREKYESQQDRMKKSFINLNQNRRRTVTSSQEIEFDTFRYKKPDNDFFKFINMAREDYDKLNGKEKQELKEIYDATRKENKQENKQLTIEDAQRQAEEIRKQKQKNKQKIFARTRVAVETEMTTDQKNRDLINRIINPSGERSVRKKMGQSGTNKLLKDIESEDFFDATKPKKGEVEKQQKIMEDFEKKKKLKDQTDRQSKAYEKNRKIIKEGQGRSKFRKIKKQYPFSKYKSTEEGKGFKERFRKFYRVKNNTLRVLSLMSGLMGGSIKLTLYRMLAETAINDLLYNPVADGTMEAQIEMMEANRAAQIENLSKLILSGEIDVPDTGFGEYTSDDFATPPSFQLPMGGSNIPFNYSGVLTQEDEYKNMAEELIKLRLGER